MPWRALGCFRLHGSRRPPNRERVGNGTLDVSTLRRIRLTIDTPSVRFHVDSLGLIY